MFEEKGEPKNGSNRGPSAYQPSALIITAWPHRLTQNGEEEEERKEEKRGKET